MAEVKTMRLSKVLRELNISLDRAVEHLASNGHDIDARPTTKISDVEYEVLFDEFQTDKSKKVASKEVGEEKRKEKEELRLAREKELEEKQPDSRVIKAEAKLDGPKQVGKIDLDADKDAKEKPVEVETETAVEEKTPIKKVAPKKTKAVAKKETTTKKKATKKVVEEEPAIEEGKVEDEKETTVIAKKVETVYKKLDGPKITGTKIDLSKFKKPEKKKEVKADKDTKSAKKSRRRRISKESAKGGNNFRDNRGRGRGRTHIPKEEPTE